MSLRDDGASTDDLPALAPRVARCAHLPQPTLWCRQLLCLWQSALPADGVAEEYGEKIDDFVVPEATASKAHLRADGRKDALFAKIGDDQCDLPEPGRGRGHRLG